MNIQQGLVIVSKPNSKDLFLGLCRKAFMLFEDRDALALWDSMVDMEDDELESYWSSEKFQKDFQFLFDIFNKMCYGTPGMYFGEHPQKNGYFGFWMKEE